MSKVNNDNPPEFDALDDALDQIRLLLPMAKGYAAEHRVGSNQAYIESVENWLRHRGLVPPSEPPRETQWMDIETAPKDETRIILWWPYWSQNAIVGQFYLGRWWAHEALHNEENGPTHWMPLPAPPVIDAITAEK